MSKKTLNKDIKLIQKTNNKYDLNFVVGDVDVVDGLESLQNAILITTLTGFQELFKTENPTYTNFGDKAYELLKANKNKNTKYKVEQYLKECILRIRRVKKVNELIVTDSDNGYEVYVRVTSITDDDLKVKVNLNTNTNLLDSFLEATLEYPYASTELPLQLTVTLYDEVDNPLSDEILYIYINNNFVGTTKLTDDNGQTTYEYIPIITETNNTLKVLFKGNNEYNSTFSILTFESEAE